MAANNSTMLRTLLSTLVCCLLICLPVFANKDGDYVISVYQPRMVADKTSKVTREEAVAHMNRHILEYEIKAAEAAKENSQILVLPEYCLYADIKDFSRNSIENFLEPIPDPKVTFPWTPCNLENATDDIAIQKKLSCMAKKNNIYIVANVGERKDCNRTVDNSCPVDDRYQFNTNVVYAPNGTLVSRYRKKHLFYEPYFNEPRIAEHGVFDTPFGRFASIVCFDIYYEDTLNELIQRQNVRNIIFPNMWFNLSPLFLSVPFHSSVAWAANINLISANIIVDKPQNVTSFVTGGSGFYSGMSGFSYMQTPSLLTVPMSNIKPGASSNFAQVPKREIPAQGDQKVVIFLVGLIEVKSVQLMDKQGLISVCNGNFCCALDYEFVSEPNSSMAYMLGAANYADGSGQYDAQACSVCTVLFGKMSCEGIPVDKDARFARFNRLRMFANSFKTTFLYPQVTVMYGTSYQVLHQNRYYNRGKINLVQKAPLHSMSLLGRIYPPHVSSTSHPIFSAALIIGALVFSLL